MAWSKPDFVEIKMDAEISSYQEDFDPTRGPEFARGSDGADKNHEATSGDDRAISPVRS